MIMTKEQIKDYIKDLQEELADYKEELRQMEKAEAMKAAEEKRKAEEAKEKEIADLREKVILAEVAYYSALGVLKDGEGKAYAESREKQMKTDLKTLKLIEQIFNK